MILSNYDFHDLHSILTMLRAKPEKEYNIQIIGSVLKILSEPQIDNTIDDNIVRKQLRSIDSLDKEYFRWVYVDNIYPYGLKFIKEDFYYSFLKKGFSKLLERAKNQDYKQLETLADALHNIPIFFAEGCKNFKKAVKIQFAQYNSIYKTNLMKELSN
ncbi:MAG: hypothetical protein IKB72_05020 [Ruminococcus sp.]|nr:hypothetical protein [Ruminococcus sp.]